MPDLNLYSSLITEEAELRKLESEWNDLWISSPKSGFFQSYSLCIHSWNEIAKPSKRSLFCITVRENEKLVLIWPLVVFWKGPFKILAPLGPSAGEPSNILFDYGSDVMKNIRLAWDTAINRSKCDILTLPFVNLNSELNAIISKANTGDRDISPYADIQDQTSWIEFCKLVGTNSHEQLNRKRRRLGEMGKFEFIAINPVEKAEMSAELIDWMMLHKQNWAKRSGKEGPWLFSSNYRNFLLKLITDPQNIQKFILYAIVIDNMPIAVKLVAFGSEHVDLIIAGYHSDSKYAKYSPGLVLDEFWVEKIFEKRLNIEFGVGKEPYKLFWSRGNKHDMISYHIPLSAIGKIGLTGLSMVRKFRQSRKA
jgi:CelD/BcsL family acetyltransferase involved in cellulose biosynthesis